MDIHIAYLFALVLKKNVMVSQGKVEVTIAGGKIVWENGELRAVRGSGKYVEMQPFSYLFSGLDKLDAKYRSSLRAPVQRSKAAN